MGSLGEHGKVWVVVAKVNGSRLSGQGTRESSQPEVTSFCPQSTTHGPTKELAIHAAIKRTTRIWIIVTAHDVTLDRRRPDGHVCTC